MNTFILCGLTSGVGLILIGQAPIPIPAAADDLRSWASLGGAGLLFVVLMTILTRTLPKMLDAQQASNKVLSTAIEKAAESQDKSSESLNKTLLDMTRHCATRKTKE